MEFDHELTCGTAVDGTGDASQRADVGIPRPAALADPSTRTGRRMRNGPVSW